MSLSSETLNLLLEYLQESGSGVFASPEDADFFRKRQKVPLSECPTPKVESPPAKPVPLTAAAKEEPIPEPPFPPSPNPSTLKKILSVAAPELAILDEIPSDATARKIAERWKTKSQSAPISVLSLSEPPEQKALLEQIAKALDIYFGPAKIVHAEGIEKDKQWKAFLSIPELKMIVACDYTLWQLHELMHFYKETPTTGTRVLGTIPLFLLPDLSLYLKDPLLKRSLWKALSQKCS